MQLRVGDHVRLRHGHTKMIIIRIEGDKAYARYCSSPTYYKNPDQYWYDAHRCISGFIRWDLNDPRCTHDHAKPLSQPLGEIDMNTPTQGQLYQTTEKKVRYGTFLVTNNSGQFVLEMKGENGKVEAFDENKLIKVIPYTFSAKLQGGPTLHYSGTKDSVKIGDVLLSESGEIYVVKLIDTGCANPHKEFKGSKLRTTPLK